MKEKNRKPNMLFTFFGVILIIFGLIVLINQIVIKDAVGKSIPARLLENISVYQTWTGYDVSIKFSPEDDRFKYDSICGLTAINFLNDIKKRKSEIDQKIDHYNFIFTEDSSVTYTAAYDNTTDSDEVKLALTEDDILLKAKSYKEYSAESYKLRNVGSTLFQHDQDYYSKYFLIDNAAITFDDKKPTIKFSFKNTSNKKYTEVRVLFAYIYESGYVTDNDIAIFYNIEAGKTYIFTIREGYVNNCNFIIRIIALYSEENPEGEHFAFD